MTQNERVSAALNHAGPLGLTQVDFLLPNVIDGGAPITRLGARIKDLKDAGQPIETAGTRQKCAVYRRPVHVMSRAAPTAIPEMGAAVTGVGPALALDLAEEKTGAQCAIFDDWEDAA